MKTQFNYVSQYVSIKDVGCHSPYMLATHTGSTRLVGGRGRWGCCTSVDYITDNCTHRGEKDTPFNIDNNTSKTLDSN